MNSKASSMQTIFTELYAQAIEAISGTTYSFENSIEAMTSGVNEIVKGLIDLDMDDNFGRLHRTLQLGQDAAAEFAQTQQIQSYDNHGLKGVKCRHQARGSSS